MFSLVKSAVNIARICCSERRAAAPLLHAGRRRRRCRSICPVCDVLSSKRTARRGGYQTMRPTDGRPTVT